MSKSKKCILLIIISKIHFLHKFFFINRKLRWKHWKLKNKILHKNKCIYKTKLLKYVLIYTKFTMRLIYSPLSNMVDVNPEYELWISMDIRHIRTLFVPHTFTRTFGACIQRVTSVFVCQLFPTHSHTL